MFAIGINYLNGWAMAAVDGAEKRCAEWPPHPDRIFMALAAAWFETGEDAAEGDALRWLEGLSPPSIGASDYKARSIVDCYVPVNDTNISSRVSSSSSDLKKAGLPVLPEYRTRKERRFPVAIPYDPNVYLVWPDIDLGPQRAALEQLSTKVTCIGSSASFVQVWVEEKGDLDVRWVPTDGVPNHSMRVPTLGRLDRLVRYYNQNTILEYNSMIAQASASQGKEKRELNKRIKELYPHPPKILRPTPGHWQGYHDRRKEPSKEVPDSTPGSNLVVLAIRGRRVPLTATLKLTQALRGAVMASCLAEPPPEWLSGHRSDGSPSTKPHMALIPLPFTGSRYADGRVMGVALVLPNGLDPTESKQYVDTFLFDQNGLPRIHKLFDGRWLECAIEIETGERPPMNLNVSTWTRKSRVWASVTPVVLNRHFNGHDRWDQAAENIKEACVHVGLPYPKEVLLHPISRVEGVPHAREFPTLPRKSDGGRRSHNHAMIVFAESVRGPVLVGAGRYRGYGLFRPMD